MSCPRCTHWLQVGLVLLTSSFASVAHGAVIDTFGEQDLAGETVETLVIPLATNEVSPTSPVDGATNSTSIEQVIPLPNQLSGETEVDPVEPNAQGSTEGNGVEDRADLSPASPSTPQDEVDMQSEDIGEDGLPDGALPRMQVFEPTANYEPVTIIDGTNFPDGALPRSRVFEPAMDRITALDIEDEVLIAQITPDDTLGDERSVLTPEVEVRGLPADLVEGGAARESNLFHSFLEFNVDAGQRVYFANPVAISRIFSRITGGNPSNIDGLLGVDGAASLYLLNPNGVMFGPEASLDIAGSFVVSTAEGFGFENGSEFNAVAPGDGSLLTVSVPLGLQVGPAPRDDSVIASQGTLAAGQDLMLFADEVHLQGQIFAGGNLTLYGADTVLARDSVDTPFIAFAGEDLLVQGNKRVDIVVLSHPESGLFSGGDMVLRSANRVNGDAHYWSGGNFQIEALSGNLGELYSPIDPIIRSFGNVSFESYEGTSLHILAGGSVSITSVEITDSDPGILNIDFLRENILLSDGQTQVNVDGGARPTLDIRAGVSTNAIGFEAMFPTGFDFLRDRFPEGFPQSQGLPVRADITIANAAIIPANGQILLTNQYQPNPSQDGNINISGGIGHNVNLDPNGFGTASPDSGIFIDSRGNVQVGTTDFFTRITTAANGEVGDITILANGIFNLLDTEMLSALVDTGTAGDITVRANEIDIINTRGISAQGSLGDSGNISFESEDIFTFRNGAISTAASLFSNGNGGDITILGSEIYIGGVLDGISQPVSISSSIFGDSQATAGDILIGDENTTVVDISVTGINAGFTPSDDVKTQLPGIGGSISIRADNVFISSSTINTDTGGVDGQPGEPGNILLQGLESIVLEDNGSFGLQSQTFFDISASTTGTSNAGSITVDAPLVIVDNTTIGTLSDPVLFDASSQPGDGGIVRILASELQVINESEISASTRGSGNAGSVIIEDADIVRFDNSFASTEVGSEASGDGGVVRVSARLVELVNGSEIRATSTGQGNAGNVILSIDETLRAVDGSVLTNAENTSGGAIDISASVIRLLGDSDITTFVNDGDGGGGSITIRSDSVIAFDDSDILAFSIDGRGGNITIEAPYFFGDSFEPAPPNTDPRTLDNNDRVDVNASGAVNGVIDIPDVSLIQNNLSELADTLVDPNTLTAGSCIARTDQSDGYFITTGTDGLPLRPNDAAASQFPAVAVQPIPSTDNPLVWQPDAPIIEPTGVYQLEDGRIVLSRGCS
ncbi:MAG: filamentous hemagglutinin N-terminal domain-containing protein [Cyanobacteria bacterium P01_A01_bin.123]